MALRKIKILNVIPTYDINGGIQNYVYNLLKELDSKQFKLEILAYGWHNNPSSKNEYKEMFENLGIATHSVSDPSRNMLGFMKEVKNFFLNNKYDIVHVHPSSTAWYFLFQAAKAGIKCRILHVHETRLSDKALHRIRNSLFFPIGKYFATQYAAVSKASANMFFKNKDAVIIYPVLDKNKFMFKERFRKSWRKKLDLKDSDFVLGVIGRFCNAKNIEFALRVMLEVGKNNNNKLVVCGDGELRAKYLNLIKRWNLEDVVIMIKPISNIHELYSALDCLIMPSLHEGLGLVAVEGQYNGLPVFASNYVPKDVDLGNCKYLKLLKNVWIKEIRQIQLDHKRSFNLAQDRFGAQSNVKILSDFYLNSWLKCCSL